MGLQLAPGARPVRGPLLTAARLSLQGHGPPGLQAPLAALPNHLLSFHPTPNTVVGGTAFGLGRTDSKVLVMVSQDVGVEMTAPTLTTALGLRVFGAGVCASAQRQVRD